MAKRAEVFTDMNMFLDGAGKIGVAEELTPPKITTKTEEYRGAGMNAPVEINMGTEKLEASFTVKEYVKSNFKLLGVLRDNSKDIVFRGSIDDGSKEKPIIVTMRGSIKEVDFGTWKSGEAGAVKYACSLDYYKLEIDGEEVIEIDVINTIYKVNGDDRLEQRRKNLGA